MTIVLTGEQPARISGAFPELPPFSAALLPDAAGNPVPSGKEGKTAVLPVSLAPIRHKLRTVLPPGSPAAAFLLEDRDGENSEIRAYYLTGPIHPYIRCSLNRYARMLLSLPSSRRPAGDREGEWLAYRQTLTVLLLGFAVLEYPEQRAVSVPDPSLTPARQLELFLRAHLDSATLPSLAAFFGYSEAYASRFIKKETGMNFGEILRRERMREASRLLLESDEPEQQIAERVGLTDLRYFRLLFKAHYHMTPGRYREGKR